ncbi:hypothetical protein FSP39_010216 [Pinctada imbricata]|uniref:Proteasome assembly chaperone 1 n=1 Tax=Pinctada imbricata TaxID=66713 RepID=A0AA89C0E8_PINIB|nr:hypothetical protein FSP39_010216 [Pinctada imbricata]
MATFFGEILPVRSRAVDDDEEDEDYESQACPMTVRWSPAAKASMSERKDQKMECLVFVMAIGPAATGFSQTYITHTNYEILGAVFGGMNDGDINSIQQTSPADKCCYIYRNKEDPTVFVCQCNLTVLPENSFSFVSQLFPCFDFDHATISILCTASTSEYKGEKPISDMNPPFLRALKTTKVIATPTCPYLEQPNMISGLPAQVMAECQMHNIKATMYICFADTIFLDSLTMRAFIPVLQTTPIKDIIQKNPKCNEMMRTLVDLHSQHNTLYL